MGAACTAFFCGSPALGAKLLGHRAGAIRREGAPPTMGRRALLFFVGAPPSGRSFLGLASLCSAKARLLGSAQPGENLEGVVAVGGFVEIAGEDQLVGLGLLQKDLQPRADFLRPADQCHAEEVADGVLFVR